MDSQYVPYPYGSFNNLDQPYDETRAFLHTFNTYPTGVISMSPRSSTIQRFLSESDRPLFRSFVPEFEMEPMQTIPDRPPPLQLRPSSPEYSSPESSNGSSIGSDAHDHSELSPRTASIPYGLDHFYGLGYPFVYDYDTQKDRHDSLSGGSCVAMHDVQKCADEPPEIITFEAMGGPYNTYGSYAQEGYQPMPEPEEKSKTSESTPTSEAWSSRDTPQQDLDAPFIRRRRTRCCSPVDLGVSAGRVGKKGRQSRRTSGSRTADPQANSPVPSPASNRAFPCPLAIYGCKSTFGSKNEWKRHVNTQHMRLGFWRCDQCPHSASERKPNDFNRKDLFMQHVRRMHSAEVIANGSSSSKNSQSNVEEQALQEAAKRCYRPLRTPPEDSRCLFCPDTFQGVHSWDERMEHIGRHMELARKENGETASCQSWRVDESVQAWLAKHNLIVRHSKHWILNM